MKNARTLMLGTIALILATASYYWFSTPRPDTPINGKARSLYELSQNLIPLHSTMGPSDWLDNHEEPGQSFGKYSRSRHIKLTDDRKVLYVLPLGEFDEKQMKIVKLSAEFLSLFFACEVKTMETQGLDVIPQKARRVHPSWGMRQIHSWHVLHRFLAPQLPKDAVALISLTSSDLYPQESWNFVYGQASLSKRVGVWSIFRNGDPETEFETVLLRTLKTATHETGHMFSIEHCIAYECNMCGANNREESDQHPAYLCPECVSKIWWATECDPLERFAKLQKFCERNNLKEEAQYYAQAIDAIGE